MKFTALPYIDLNVSNKKYKDFLLRKFDVGNLYRFNEDSEVFFLDWRGVDMIGWYKLINPNCNVTIEFYIDEYKIHMGKKIHTFMFPTTINDFISDCKRVDLKLYWDYETLDKYFELKVYALEEESKEYYKELLIKIEKEDVF